MSCRRALISALALILVALATPGAADAQAPRGQPIYARNNTNRPIWVAAKYMPAGERNYITNGFWRVAPGAKVLLYYNNAVFNYMYARDDQGHRWSGNYSVVVRGETVSMFDVDTGHGYEPLTWNFNP